MIKKISLVLLILMILSTSCFASSWIRCGYTDDGNEFSYDADTIRHVYNSNNVALTTGTWRVMNMNTKTGNVYKVGIRESDLAFMNIYLYEYQNGQLVYQGSLNESLQVTPRGSNFERLFSEMVNLR